MKSDRLRVAGQGLFNAQPGFGAIWPNHSTIISVQQPFSGGPFVFILALALSVRSAFHSALHRSFRF